MPDWLDRVFESDVDTSVPTLVGRQLIALALGCVVGFIYRLAIDGTRDAAAPSNRQRGEMVATLVLLTVLIAMMTAVIGDNIARAFSIVGALSIVRFRTVVEDTRDTAFVICAVAVGMAVGAGHIVLPLITIPIVAVAAMLFRPRGIRSSRNDGTANAGSGGDFQIAVRTGAGRVADTAVRAVLAPHASNVRVLAIESARQGAAFETTYAVFLLDPGEAHAVIAAINGVEGVQNVELRRV